MTKCSRIMTARGLKTAADQLQKCLVEQIGFSFAARLLTKRGRSLIAGKDQVNSVWPCSWAFCASKGVTFQEGAGARKPNLQQGSQGPVFPTTAAPQKAGRAGQAGSGGRRAGQGLQNFQLEKWELVLLLP